MARPVAADGVPVTYRTFDRMVLICGLYLRLDVVALTAARQPLVPENERMPHVIRPVPTYPQLRFTTPIQAATRSTRIRHESIADRYVGGPIFACQNKWNHPACGWPAYMFKYTIRFTPSIT